MTPASPNINKYWDYHNIISPKASQKYDTSHNNINTPMTTTKRPWLVTAAVVLCAALLLLLYSDIENTAFCRTTTPTNSRSGMSSLLRLRGGQQQQPQQKTLTSNSIANKDEGEGEDPAGYFNNLPVYYTHMQPNFHSTAHCIGENFVDSPERKSNSAWKYRSCHFQNLCFDMADREFVLFTSEEQRSLENALRKVGPHQFWTASNTLNDTMAVSVGGLHPRWGGLDVALKWYPKFRTVDELDVEENNGFYMLPKDTVFVPWNSYYGYNPGHIITDDFLPIYTLLSYFGLTDKELAMIHIDLPNNDQRENPSRWDNCQNHWTLCKPYMEKFLPLLGTTLDQTSTQYTASFVTNDLELEIMGITSKSRYVCAPNGVAGMGMLTDHGKKLHGNFPKDFLWTHNIGRGDSFYRFRNWMVSRIRKTDIEKKDLSKAPYVIVISNNSSTDKRRNISLRNHADMLRKKLGRKYDLDIRQVRLADMSMEDQLKLAGEASMFITAAGGGVSFAHFLPRGASLLIYFAEFPPDKNVTMMPGQYNGWVMDYDLYNNFGYIRTHWLPIRDKNSTDNGGRQSATDMDVFIKLVDQELDIISHVNDND